MHRIHGSDRRDTAAMHCDFRYRDAAGVTTENKTDEQIKSRERSEIFSAGGPESNIGFQWMAVIIRQRRVKVWWERLSE